MSSEESALPRTAEPAEELTDTSPAARREIRLPALARLLSAPGGLLLFVFALQLIKAGARAVLPLLSALDVSGPVNALGFGWLGAYLSLSGSPVAAIGISLLAGGSLSVNEAFAVVGGSRLGASFIVLAVGYVLYLGGRRNADGLSIGVIALLTTFTTQGPAIALGLLSLHYGWLDGVQFTPPDGALDAIDRFYGPPVQLIDSILPAALVFACGVGVLLVSFALFDRALPRLEAGSPGFERAVSRLDGKWLMFVAGCAVTAMTLSVSISLTLLVPLSLKGYLRRQQVIPYVMGANITTFVDTLAGALALGGAAAFTVVLTEMLAVTAISAAILFVAYDSYARAILGLASKVTHNRRTFSVFLGAIVAVPAVLLLL